MKLREQLVSELRVGDPGPAEKSLQVAPLLAVGLARDPLHELLVDLRVDPADEKARHAVDLAHVAAPPPKLFEPGEEGLHDLDVALDRKDEGDVDVHSLADHRLDRAKA